MFTTKTGNRLSRKCIIPATKLPPGFLLRLAGNTTFHSICSRANLLPSAWSTHISEGAPCMLGSGKALLSTGHYRVCYSLRSVFRLHQLPPDRATFCDCSQTLRRHG